MDGEREKRGRVEIWSEEIEMGVTWLCLSKSTICCQIARHESKGRDPFYTHTDTHAYIYTHSKPHMSFNMYADGQAVTQRAPKRA